MTRFWRFGNAAISHCKICRKSVAINARPLPNGIDIAGEAVALNCLESRGEGKERRRR